MNLQPVRHNAWHGPKRGQPIWMIYDFDVADDRASRLFPNGYRHRKDAEAAITSHINKNNQTNKPNEDTNNQGKTQK